MTLAPGYLKWIAGHHWAEQIPPLHIYRNDLKDREIQFIFATSLGLQANVKGIDRDGSWTWIATLNEDQILVDGRRFKDLAPNQQKNILSTLAERDIEVQSTHRPNDFECIQIIRISARRRVF